MSITLAAFLARRNGTVAPKPPVALPNVRDILEIVLTNADISGFVDLVIVRQQLTQRFPDATRQDQDAAINDARRCGLVTGTARESRQRITDDQLNANLEGGIGFLSVRE